MKAVVLNGFGGPENLVLAEIPKPVINDQEVLVQVKAISLNPVDCKTRTGKALAARLAQESPVVLGWDVAGVVVGTGSEVTEFKAGDEVFGMINFPGHGKAYAEQVAAPASHLVKKPANISFEEAAAGTLAALTAWQTLVHHAHIKPGNRVLVHAAAGGVGHFAVQIAKHFEAWVVGTSSRQNKAFVLSLGADEHIDYKVQPFEKVVHDIDIVLDAIGGDYIDRSLEVLKPGGTLISIVSGMNEQVVEKAAAKSVNGLRTMVQSSGADMQALARGFEQGWLKSHVSAIFPLEQMAEAHRLLETGRTVGKIVVIP